MKFKIQDLSTHEFIALIETLNANDVSFVYSSTGRYLLTVSDKDYELIEEPVEENANANSNSVRYY